MINRLNALINESPVAKDVIKAMLHRLQGSGGFLISDISNECGYSVTTVAKYSGMLVTEGILHEVGDEGPRGRGRRAVRYQMDCDACLFLGVDMKMFELNIGIVNLKGDMVHRETFRDFKMDNTYDSFRNLCSRIKTFMDALDSEVAGRIVSANINIPGRVNSRYGTSASTYALEGFGDTPLADIFTEELGIRTYIENDTKSMTLGELSHPENSGVKNFVFLNVSWGLAAGIVIDGKLYGGHDGYSGEFGHIHFFDNNILCHCGKQGCMETEISGRALIRRVREGIRKGEATSLLKITSRGIDLTMEHILDAVRREDPLCIGVLSDMGRKLGVAAAGLINLLNPELIVLGGTFSSFDSNYFFQPMEITARQYALKLVSRNTSMITSRLGDDVGLAGACLCARNRYIFGDKDY